jgi:hypothetical protein
MAKYVKKDKAEMEANPCVPAVASRKLSNVGRKLEGDGPKYPNKVKRSDKPGYVPAKKGGGRGVKTLTARKILTEFYLAYGEMGGLPALAKWGEENPDNFYPLLEKLLTQQIIAKAIDESEGGGDGSQDRHVYVVRFSDINHETGIIDVTPQQHNQEE